jgi:hypothetical protein
MTIALTGTGGLFTRVGRVGGLLNALNSFRGTANLSSASIVSVGTGVDNLYAQFNSADQAIVTHLYAQRDSYRSVHSSWTQYLQSVAQQIVIQMANDDTPLARLDLPTALALLISQMKSGSQTVAKPTISATVTAGGSNNGGGVMVVSNLGPGGLQQDYEFNESLVATCISDSQKGATAGQEQFSVLGPTVESDPLQWDWPLGSGAALSLSAVDALVDNSSGNLLQNGAFKTFTNSNAPDNWPIATGTAGTTIFQATGSNVYKGSSGLTFTGNGTELTSIQQPFNTAPSTILGAGGSSAVLGFSTQYAVNCFLKVSSVPAAGVLEIALVDGSGTITTDANGVQNKITQSLPAATTSFLPLNGFFRTPAALPTQLKLRVRLSTALDSAKSVYVGHLALTPVTQLYVGGPWGAIFSGTPVFLLNDTFTAAISNNYSSAWQKLAERLFNMRRLGLALPSGGSPTINDNLIA